MGALIVVGAGPGIGAAVTRHGLAQGQPVGLVARSAGTLEPIAADLRRRGHPVAWRTADVSDEDRLGVALDDLTAEVGVPELVVYNVGLIRSDAPGELDDDALAHTFRINVLGALRTVTRLAPSMVAAGGGTVILTGGMPSAVPTYVSLSVGKAALRALAELLAVEYGPRGVQIVSVTVGGVVAPGGRFDPDEIAAEYWRLHRRPPQRWRAVVSYEPPAAVARPS